MINFEGIYEKESFINKSLNAQKEISECIEQVFSADKTTITDKLILLFNEAENNNIPVIEYLSKIYFADDYGVESNMYFATCLALWASANGSKIASSRIRSLLYPAYQYVISHIDKISLYDMYNLTDENCEDFIMSHISSVMVFELKLNIKDIIDMRTHLKDFDDFMVLDLEDLREEKLDKFVDYLGL